MVGRLKRSMHAYSGSTLSVSSRAAALLSAAMDSMILSLRQRGDFVRGLAEDQSFVGRRERQVTMLCEKMHKEHIDMADIEGIKTAINDGPWTPDQMSRLTTEAISAVLLHDEASFERNRKSARAVQAMPCVEKYLTEVDLDMISRAGVPITRKINLVASRLAKLGVTCPNTKLLKRGAAVICALHHDPEKEPMSAKEKQSVALQLRTALKRFDEKQAADNALPHLPAFPECPEDLTQTRWNAAYVGDQTPAPVDVLERYLDWTFVARLERDIAIRDTHKSLLEEGPARPLKKDVPVLSLRDHGADSPEQSFIANIGVQFLKQMFSSGLPSVHDAPGFAKFGRTKATVLALQDQPAATVATSDDDTENEARPEPTGDKLARLEAHMVSLKGAGAAANAKAKGKAKSKAKAKAKTKAKAEAKTKAKPDKGPKLPDYETMKETYKHSIAKGKLNLTIQKNAGVPFFKLFADKQQILQAKIGNDPQGLFEIMRDIMTLFASKKIKHENLIEKRDQLIKKRSAAAAGILE